ncbi:MAG: tetratricopeptide repeat protein [Nitrospina sp.]|nr:tetratricopeptide repeat protein [Nitrospina sp.]
MHYLKIKKILVPVLVFCLISAIFVYSAQANAVTKSALVLLIAKDTSGKILGTGTGFIVRSEGTLVTNYHVLLDAKTIEAITFSGDRLPIKAILKVDRAKDFALLQLPKGVYSTLEVGDSDTLKNFDFLSALGFLSDNINYLERPLDPDKKNSPKEKVMQTFGFVLGVHPQAQPDLPFIYTTASFGPGFSGGPVVDQENRVIGIATVEGKSINLAVPINFIKPFLDTKANISLNDLLEEDKTSKEAHYFRGNYYLYVKGDADRATTEFQAALKLDDSFVLAHYDLGAAYQSQGLTERAIKEYQKATSFNPSFPEGNSNLGGYYFRMKKYDLAIKHFRQAINAYPNFIQAHSNLGAVLNKLSRSEEAIPHLKKAIQLDPEFAIGYFNLGNAHFNQGNLNEAKKSYDLAMSKGINFLSLHWNLYDLYTRQNKRLEAKQELEIILQIEPENIKAKEQMKEFAR